MAQVSKNYELETFKEASSHPNWDATMNEEYISLMENDTWDVIPLPKGIKLVKHKWIYRTKYGPKKSIDRCKD